MRELIAGPHYEVFKSEIRIQINRRREEFLGLGAVGGGRLSALSKRRRVLLNNLLNGKMKFVNGGPDFPCVFLLHPLACGFVGYCDPEIALFQGNEGGPGKPVLKRLTGDLAGDVLFNLFPRVHADTRN